MLKSYKTGFFVKAITLACIILSVAKINAQVYYHNFGTGTINTHPYTVAPVTIASNLSQVSWTNSTNNWTNLNGANSTQAIALSNSGSTTLITLTLSVAPNYQLSVTSFDFWRQRSASGPQNWAMAVNGTTVGNGTVPTSGATIGNSNVSTPITNLTGTVTITLTLTGASGNGTFRLDDFTLYGSVTSSCGASVTSFSPASGPQGTVVIINGSGFTGATAVKFGGTNAASFTVVDNSTIRAVAPAGTSSGVVSVTASSGCSGDSASSFTHISGSCTPPPTDLFISEIYDQNAGSGGMIELYNASGATINFSGQYLLKRYGNITDTNPSTGYTLTLTGSLAAGATRLVACTSPNTAQCVPPAAEGPDSFGGINDNDKIELVKNGSVIDVAHTPPTQPGFTMIRKADAIVPSASYNASDWNITLHPVPTPLGNTYCSTLGSHTINGAASPTVTQPVSQGTCTGGNATFTVSLSNPSGFTYQWKVLNASGNWVNVTNGANYSGATTATLIISNAPVSFNGNQYYVQMTSSTCSLPSNAVQLSVSTAATPVASATQQPDCTTPTGTITVTSPTGQSYSVDGTNYVSTMAFSGLTAGTYTVYVKNAAGCVSSLSGITINPAPSAPATPVASATQQPDCTTATGTITVTSPTGQSYSVDGTNYVSTMAFSGLASGTYTVYVKNAAGCVSQLSGITINPAPSAPATPVASATQQPDCTTPTGTITVTSPTGQSYSVDGTNYASTMAFSGLTAGTYTVYVKNAAGCVSQLSGITINPAPSAPATPVASATQQPDCTTATGTITVTSPTGQSYSIDGTNYVSTMAFSGLAPGSYTVYVKNAAGCVSSLSGITINPAPSAPATPVASATQQPDCATATGTITVTSPTGQSYSVDGMNYVSTTVFSGLATGTYTVYVKNAAGCVSQLSGITINPTPSAPATPVASATQQPDCTTATGTITITSPTGQSYSIDGMNYVSTMAFSGLTAGTYTVYVKNAAGCVSSLNNIVINPAPSAPATPVASATQQPDCTTATGTITITSPTGQSYSVDGTNYVSTMAFGGLASGTYTVYVKNAAGCVSQLSGITINPGPAAPTIPVASVTQQPDCTTATGTITVSSPTGMTYSIDGVNYGTAMSFSGLAPGSYTVYVKNAGCVSSLSGIAVNTQPATPPAPTYTVTQPTCQITGGSIAISSPIGNFTYSINGGPFQASANFSGLAQGTYTLVARSVAGCVSPASAPITINAQPQVPTTPSVSVIQPTCAATTGTITVNAPIGAGLTYSIDNVNFQSSPAFANLAPGNYTVRVKNADGCTATAPAVINMQPATPAAPLLSAVQPNCSQATGSITVNSPTGAGLTYSLDGGAYQASALFNAVAPGLHTVTVKNSSGCTAASSPVTINPAPMVPAAPTASVTQQPSCATPTGTITITAPIGAGLQYSVDGIAYSSATTFTGLVSGSYTVYVKNASGCTATRTGLLVNPQPATPGTPLLSVAQPTCNTATGSVTVTTPLSPSLTYSINGGAYQSSPSFTGLSAGIYTVTVKNAAGCVSVASASVTINPQPATPALPTIVPTQPDCTTPTGTITVNAPVGAGLEYSINGTTWQPTNVFAGLAPGLYTVRVRNSEGCSSQAQTRIIPQPSTPAVPTYTLIQPNCTTATGTITVTSPSGAYTYSADGTTFLPSRSFSGLAPGTYTITVKNNAGCTSVSGNITIDAPPAPAPSPGTITGSIAVCSGGTVQLTNTATGGTWSSSNTNIATVDSNGLVTTLFPGSVVIRYTTGTICTASATHTLRVDSLPNPMLPAELVTCIDNTTNIGSPVTIATNMYATAYSFTWKKNGTALPDTTSSITVNEPATYEVTVTNIATGCTATDETVVKASSLAIAYAEVTQDFDFRQTIEVHVTGGVGNYTYSLNDGPYQDSPVFSGIYQGEYTIKVKDDFCGETELTVYALNYPRFFSPNGDGNNDRWNIKGLAAQQNARIYIFDRFGKIVSSIKPNGPGWDGMYNGERLPATDYWFTLQYMSSKGEEKEFKAHFSLVR